MIREATRNDSRAILELLLKDAEERGWEEQSGAKVDPYSVHTIIQYHIRDSNGVAYVSEKDQGLDGYFLGCVMPFLLDLRHMAAHEKMAGGENVELMWERFKDWARNRNAITAVRCCYDKSNQERFRRM